MSYTNTQKVRILYKSILRLHRGLPAELSELGNTYARDEFKRHKKCNPSEAEVFLGEWTGYALTLAEQLGLKGPVTGAKTFGAPLSLEDLDNFRDEQLHQLFELLKASGGQKAENKDR